MKEGPQIGSLQWSNADKFVDFQSPPGRWSAARPPQREPSLALSQECAQLPAKLCGATARNATIAARISLCIFKLLNMFQPLACQTGCELQTCCVAHVMVKWTIARAVAAKSKLLVT
jgi:hypothetical protein